MVIRRSGLNGLNAELRAWLTATVTFVALGTLVVTFSTRTVHAKVLLPQPAASVPPSLPGVHETAPKSLTPKMTIASERAALLRGLASWYGTVFDGRQTASGETFDMNAMTACHPTLPFGSVVRVVNLRNKRSVIVRITDRGDLAACRIIDLSYGAAKKLAMTERGLAPVVLEVISKGPKGSF